MNSSCIYCNLPSEYYCECDCLNVNLCGGCRKNHRIYCRNQNIIPLQSVQILPQSQAIISLVKKITEAKQEANSKLQVFESHAQVLVSSIFKKVSKFRSRIRNFTRTCNENIIQLLEIRRIDKKKCYNPLESALIKNNVSDLINQITSPILTFPEIILKCEYTPSSFPHFIFNYSDLSICNPLKYEFSFFPNEITLKFPEVYGKCKFLNLGKKKIMIIGGLKSKKQATKSVYILNLLKQILTKIADLNTARRWMAVTWIKGRPAAIGGIDTTKSLKSVEVFTRKHIWKEIASLNIPRTSANAICSQKAVWVVGGYDEIRHQSIEKYSNKVWMLIDVKLPKNCSSVGLCCFEGILLIFGGCNKEEGVLKNVYCFDTQENSLWEIEALLESRYFPYNHFVINQGKISGWATDVYENPIITDVFIRNICV